MTIPATEAVTSTPSFPTGTTTTSSTSEDKQMFMQLMVAQLRYQDPLNPADSGEFLAQSAQFTALEKMQDVSDRVGALLGSQMAFGAGAMVGQKVSWVDLDGTTTHDGTISGVTFGAQGPVFEIDGTQVPLAQLLSVGTTTPPATPTDTPDSTPDSTDPQASPRTAV